VVRQLAQSGADVRLADAMNCTPIMHAAWAGQPRIGTRRRRRRMMRMRMRMIMMMVAVVLTP
jgi:hypothetical protein